jgi:hypothetical protein
VGPPATSDTAGVKAKGRPTGPEGHMRFELGPVFHITLVCASKLQREEREQNSSCASPDLDTAADPERFQIR